MNAAIRERVLLVLCLFALDSRPALAQAIADKGAVAEDPTPQKAEQAQKSNPPAQSEDQPRESSGKRAFVMAPLPISSPAIGSGVVPVGAFIFPLRKMDTVSPPSVIGVTGLFTNNGTRTFALGGQFYFKQDTYQITAGFGRGNINYDLYGSGMSAGLKLPLRQTGQVFQVEFLRRVGWKFFLGPRFTSGSSLLTIRTNSENTPSPPPDLGLNTNLTAVGARLTRDTSTNQFYRTNGTFFTLTSDFFSQTLGSKYSFQAYKTVFAKYWSLSRKQVLAYDAYFRATGGKPPFYGNCIYGNSNQLRGYVAGKYFDRYMVTTQLEYRLTLPLRLGLVAFGGVGEAIPGGDQLLFPNNSFLPAGGGGLRFQLSKQYHVNLRADLAGSKDGHILPRYRRGFLMALRANDSECRIAGILKSACSRLRAQQPGVQP